MGNAGRNGGEYYTPRPLIRAVIHVLKPQIGETIYDGACGSAGFHCESFHYLKSSAKLTTKDVKTLQTKTFVGKETKSLTYVIGIMHMILHGIEAPNIVHTNTLTENLADFIDRQKTFADSPKSWSVKVADIDKATFDLSVRNPDGGEEITHRSPAAIMKEIAELDAESAKVLKSIKALL